MKNIRRICFISTLSRCMVVIGLLLTLRIGVTQTEKTSRACFGIPGFCTVHNLNCGNDKIAVYKAYYTKNTECPVTGTQECDNDFDNITESGYVARFSTDEQHSLYSECSAKSQCTYRARNIQTRAGLFAFSVVKYKCVQNIADICSGTENKTFNDVSIIWSGQDHAFCTCIFSTHDLDTNFDIYVLEFKVNKTQQLCSTVDIIADGHLHHLDCSSDISPYQLLANVTRSRHVEVMINILEPRTSDRIWIRITGSRSFSLDCFPFTISSTVTVASSQGNGLSTSQTFKTLSTTSLGTTQSASSMGTTHFLHRNDKLSDQELSPGTLAGAIVPSVLVIGGIVIFIVFFLRKRSKKMREKENTPVPQMDSKSPEEYSLATIIPEKIYLELENQPTVSTDYDYATVDHNCKPKPSQLPVHQVIEGDYDHIGDKQSFQNSDYDTTASVAHTMDQTIKASSPVKLSRNVQEDDYGYNHLGSNHQVETIQNEYDTSASAVKEIARLHKADVTEENDYDHCDKNPGSTTLASPYDTARNVTDRRDDYSLAGTVTGTNPYDLAK